MVYRQEAVELACKTMTPAVFIDAGQRGDKPSHPHQLRRRLNSLKMLIDVRLLPGGQLFAWASLW